MNLCNINQYIRYNTFDALRHPWITRNKSDPIPLSLNQKYQKKSLIKEFKKFLYCIICLSLLKQSTLILPLYNKVQKAESFKHEMKKNSSQSNVGVLKSTKETYKLILPKIGSKIIPIEKINKGSISPIRKYSDQVPVSDIRVNNKYLSMPGMYSKKMLSPNNVLKSTNTNFRNINLKETKEKQVKPKQSKRINLV